MQVIGIKEAAAMMGKTPAAMRAGFKRWKVPYFMLGGQIKFTKEALEEWIEKSMKETKSAKP